MIIITRAELDAAPTDLWRWICWCREWALIGFFVDDTARRERALWGTP